MKIPIYMKIKHKLIEQIELLETNASVPSERDLALDYKASRMTVRKAIDELVKDGYLYRDANKGTFVSDKKLHKKNTTINMHQLEEQIDYKIIYFDVKATSSLQIQEQLQIRPDDSIVRMVRLSLLNHKPQVIEEIYIKRLNLSDEEFGNLPKWKNFNAFIQQGSITQRFIPLLVPVNYAHLLGMKINDPVIMVENMITSKDGKPLVFMKVFHNPNEKIIEITQ